MNYLYYFLANCDRKNQITELVGYLTTACKQALLRNCSRRLRAVATFRELSMTSNFGCFALLHVQSKRTLIVWGLRLGNMPSNYIVITAILNKSLFWQQNQTLDQIMLIFCSFRVKPLRKYQLEPGNKNCVTRCNNCHNFILLHLHCSRNILPLSHRRGPRLEQ